jgi:hypothetical protein
VKTVVWERILYVRGEVTSKGGGQCDRKAL